MNKITRLKVVPVVFLALVAVGAFVQIYLSVNRGPAALARSEAERTHPRWAETLQAEVGPTWDSFSFLSNQKGLDIVGVKVVSDGVLLTETFPLTSLDGTVLAKARVSQRVYYLDEAGVLQSVICPVMVELPDGDQYIFGLMFDSDSKRWSDEEISRAVRETPWKFYTIRGYTFWVELIRNTKMTFSGFGSTAYAEGKRRQRLHTLIFSQSREDQLRRFIESGDPSIGILFPVEFGIPNSSSKAISLP